MDKIVCWHRWKSTTKEINNKKSSAFERGTETKPFRDLFQQYMSDVHTIHTYSFHLEWQ